MKKALVVSVVSVVLIAIFAFGCSTSSTNVSKNDTVKADSLKVKVDSLTIK
jgi:hypothetical protein